MTDITIERKLPIINGFVEIPDGKGLRVTASEALELIPGSTLVRLGVGSSVSEIQIIGEGEEAPTPFKNDHAFSFNGVDNFAQTDSTVSGIPGTGGYSISFWIKSSDFQSMSYDNILTLSDGTAQSWSNAKVRIYMSQGGSEGYHHYGRIRFKEPNPVHITSSSKLIDDVWNHVLLTSTSTNEEAGIQTIYLNGELTANGVGAAVTNVDTMTVGSTQWGAYTTLGASLDEVAVWNTALTPDQIADVYSDGKVSELSSLDTSNNLKVWWRFGDGPGDNATSTVYDQVGSANLTCYDMDASNRIDGVPASPGAISAYALSNTARQHQGDLFIKLPAYSSTASSTIDTFEQLRTGEVLVPVVIEEEEEAFKNTYSYEFDGVNDVGISAATVTGIPGSGGYTISAWVKAAYTTHDIYGGIVALMDGTVARGEMYVYFAFRLVRIVETGTTNDGPTGVLTNDTWEHVLFTSDTNTTTDGPIGPILYVDGVNVYEPGPTSSSGLTGVDNIKVGRAFSWAEFRGWIDEVAVYDTALPATGSGSVAEIYASGKAADLKSLDSEPNLKHWYRFGDGAGDDATTTVKDVIGTAHLTMNNIVAPMGRVEDAPAT